MKKKSKKLVLNGWNKYNKAKIRRMKILSSRPKHWTLHHRRLSSALALNALATWSKDEYTKKIARLDANYFFNLYRKQKNKITKNIKS